MPHFHHTPLTAAKAIRQLVEADIPKTLEDFEAQQLETQERVMLAGPPAQRGLSGRWMNSYKIYLLVKEQCNGLPHIAGMRQPKTPRPQYDGSEIQQAIQKVFPELFSDYVEALFEAEKLTLTK